MPKNKKPEDPIVPELTSSGYRAFFDNFDDSWIFEKDYPLSQDEIRVIEAIRDQLGENAQISAVRRVEKPDGIKMPDLIVNGQKVEIKKVSSKHSVRDQTRKALNQGSTAIFYNVQPKDGVSEEFLFSEIKKQTSQRGVLNYIAYKAKNTASSRERIDSVLNDLILPQKIEKVNKINAKTPLSTLNPNELGIKIYQPNKEKIKIKPVDYWQNRAAARFENQEQQSLSYIHRIKNAYTDAEIRTIREIKKLYANYYRNDKTFDKFALQGIEPSGNIARFKAEMERLGLNQYLPENYDFRMTRLEMLNHQIWAELKKAGIEQNNLTANSVINTINNSYNQAIFDTEKQFGSLLTFSKLDSRTVQEILNYKIEGKHFSNRIWTNTDILAEQINSKIATAVAIGQSPEKTIREVRERFDVGRFYAERLVRTESAFYHNSAELQAYQELGVEKYRIIATLDNRTSDICQHKDHKVFKISEAKQGVNFPPFHPLCRTTTAAYFGEEFDPETRIARNPKTGENYETPNMSYEKWAKVSGISKAEPASTPSISPADDKIEVKIKKPPTKKVNNSDIKSLKLEDSLNEALKTDDIREKVVRKLNAMPETHRSIWAKFSSELSFKDSPLGNDNFSVLGNKVSVRIAGIFDGSTGNPRDIRKPFEVFLHEYGHGFDHRAGRGSFYGATGKFELSNGKTLGETIFDEANRYLKTKEGRNLAYRRHNLSIELKNELENGYSKNDLASIFDLYGGAAFSNGLRVFGMGHEQKYWDGRKTIRGVKLSKEQIENHKKRFLGSEAFAEMFSATARDDKKEIELYEKYLPESFSMFNELLERISKL